MSTLRLHIADIEGAVPFRTFVDVMNRTRLILTELDVAISEQPRGGLRWVIRELSVEHSADAVIESLPATNFVDDRLGLRVSESFINGVRVVEQEEAFPPYFSETAVRRVGTIAQALSHNGGAEYDVTHVDAGTSIAITPDVALHAKRVVAPRYTASGSVLGKLGLISVEGRYRFNVYDALTHRAVRCRFEEEQFEEIKDALRRRVIVTGTVHRNVRGEPISVTEPQLTVLPEEGEGLTTAEIAGLDPNFTGPASVDEYVRKLRDA
jgi:hypothetical protein